MNPSQQVYTPRGEVSDTTNVEMIEFAMGSGLRGMFLLICVGAGFLFVSNEELGRLYRNFMIIFFVLLLIPWTSEFLAKTLQRVSLLALAVGRACTCVCLHCRGRRGSITSDQQLSSCDRGFCCSCGGFYGGLATTCALRGKLHLSPMAGRKTRRSFSLPTTLRTGGNNRGSKIGHRLPRKTARAMSRRGFLRCLL